MKAVGKSDKVVYVTYAKVYRAQGSLSIHDKIATKIDKILTNKQRTDAKKQKQVPTLVRTTLQGQSDKCHGEVELLTGPGDC